MELNVACWALFIAGLLIPLGVVQWIHAQHEAQPIRQLNSDFVYFYGIGLVCRTYSPSRVYDTELQQQVFRSIQPPRNGIYGPSPYPPFVALFFAALTYLSFESAYLVWFGISLVLYVIGVGAAARTAFPRDKLSRSLIYCFASAFHPFLFSNLLNGQLASVAVFATGVAIYQESRGRWLWAGVALSLLCYKPTLLMLLIPMLLLTRRFRMLCGFFAGAAFLVLVGTLFAGANIWVLYAQMLHAFGKITGAGGSSRLETWKYIDLISCFTAISGHRSGNALILFSAGIFVIAIALVILLWRSADSRQNTQGLVWAITLASTLLLNVYVPIYDSVIVTIPIIITVGALRDKLWERYRQWVILTGILIFAVSWMTQSYAHAHKIQLLTVMVMVLVVLQWACLCRILRETEPMSIAGQPVVGSL